MMTTDRYCTGIVLDRRLVERIDRTIVSAGLRFTDRSHLIRIAVEEFLTRYESGQHVAKPNQDKST